jgi:hypothetical protein
MKKPVFTPTQFFGYKILLSFLNLHLSLFFFDVILASEWNKLEG